MRACAYTYIYNKLAKSVDNNQINVYFVIERKAKSQKWHWKLYRKEEKFS
jgi:hypothetical protein